MRIHSSVKENMEEMNFSDDDTDKASKIIDQTCSYHTAKQNHNPNIKLLKIYRKYITDPLVSFRINNTIANLEHQLIS